MRGLDLDRGVIYMELIDQDAIEPFQNLVSIFSEIGEHHMSRQGMAVAGNAPDMQVVYAAHAVLFQQGLLNDAYLHSRGNAFHEDVHRLLQESP
jgi:hypothetical protein